MSDVRTRSYRARTKYAYDIIARRLKRLRVIEHRNPTDEWAFEWTVLEQLEISVFEYLEAEGVDGDLWAYYVGFVKEAWERSMKFTDLTLAQEIQSLLNEYVLRGLDLTHLQGLLSVVDYYVQWKKSDQEDETLFMSRFKVGLTANQIVNPPMQTVVQFDNETGPQYFDILGEFNPVNHRFEPKNTGYYWIRSQIVYDNFPVGSDYLFLLFRGNGGGTVMQIYLPRKCVSAVQDHAGDSILLYLPAGYYVEIQTQHGTGAPRTLLSGIYGCLFEGFRVG